MADLTYNKRIGDRRDGRLIRSLAPVFSFMPFIMRQRSDACNSFSDSLEVTDIDLWLRQKRSEGYRGMGMLHLFIAAYVRSLAYCPGVNRFVSGQRIFSRSDIQVVMSVKRELTSEAPDASIKVHFEPTDTIFDVYRKMNEKIDEIKANDGTNDMEDIAASLTRLPRFALRAAVRLLHLLDYYDKLPASVVEASPFHGSMIITDMGSLGIPPIYHHIYNFGNLPVFLSFGARRRAVEVNREGRVEERKYVDFCAVLDERICDGFYYANAFKHIKYFLRNPQLLELPPEEVREDIF
ncbi:MAG: hypothetical protein ACOX81_08760 [Candidatus Heteroscillospira sp.]|jgi:hypothetical protein